MSAIETAQGMISLMGFLSTSMAACVSRATRDGELDHLTEDGGIFTRALHLFLPLRGRNVGRYLEIGEPVKVDSKATVAHNMPTFLTISLVSG